MALDMLNATQRKNFTGPSLKNKLTSQVVFSHPFPLRRRGPGVVSTPLLTFANLKLSIDLKLCTDIANLVIIIKLILELIFNGQRQLVCYPRIRGVALAVLG